jgi:hypothetical protein
MNLKKIISAGTKTILIIGLVICILLLFSLLNDISSKLSSIEDNLSSIHEDMLSSNVSTSSTAYNTSEIVLNLLTIRDNVSAIMLAK